MIAISLTISPKFRRTGLEGTSGWVQESWSGATMGTLDGLLLNCQYERTYQQIGTDGCDVDLKVHFVSLHAAQGGGSIAH